MTDLEEPSDREPLADRDLLTRIAAGDLRPDAAAVVARRSRDPAFAAAVDDLLRTMAALDAAGAEEREWLAAAQAPGTTGMRPGLVADTIGRLASTGSGGDGTRERPRRAWWILAAAAAAAAIWFLWRDPHDSPPDDRPLGAGHLSLLAPRLQAETLILEWTTDLAGAEFAVGIWLAEDPTRRMLLEHETKETRWRIDGNDWRPLQAHRKAMRWRVVASRASLTVEGEGELVLPP